MTTETLRAAGSVLWRGDASAPEVALVHRPRYDDWTFPKGKLKTGEHMIAAAVREVREETGLTITVGRALPPIHYLLKGRTKRVDYWAGRVVEQASFVPGAEVDELVWLPLDRARARLTYSWDGGLLHALMSVPLTTVPLLLVRHGSAGSRQAWTGDDDLRPLDAEGRAQAATIAQILPAYRPELLLSSPSRRCVQTLPGLGMEIRTDRLLSEDRQDPEKTPALVDAITVPAAVCSHGKVLPELISALSGTDVHLRKGSFAVLHRVGHETVGVERYPT
ncbi:NUDIX hydrolase [Nonomuraea sp. NBC_01738]|uniref:NUDIX hydrolase n=1 Tax=Nonomuraea sp. NBC_01738 TaxID=2976003 RepID=UPI002E0E9255|nr:NUDIX hydrolase [Nonomuraea sp. NBC_01738]